MKITPARVNAFFVILTFALLQTQCKPRKVGYSVSNIKTCQVPEPLDIFFNPFPQDHANLELSGFYAPDSLAKAKKFLQPFKVDLNPDKGRVLIAETYGSSRGASRYQKEWLAVFFNQTLYLFNQQADEGFENYYVIDKILVQRMYLSSNSAHLMLVTGRNFDEIATINLSALMNHFEPEKSESVKGNDAIRATATKFLKMRSNFVKTKQKHGGTFFVQDLYKQYLSTFNEIREPDVSMDSVSFRYKWTGDSVLFTWEKLNYPEFFKSGDHILAAGRVPIFNSEDGFNDNNTRKDLRKKGPISQRINRMVSKYKFSSAKEITAMAVAPYHHTALSAEGTFDPSNPWHSPIEEYYAARMDCSDEVGGGKGNCVRVITRLSAERGSEVVFVETVPKTGEIDSKRIKRLAVSHGSEKKIAFADGKGFYLLTQDKGQLYRIKKKFFSRARIDQLDFFRHDPASPYNGDQLMVRYKEKDGSLNREIARVDLMLGGLAIGKLPENPAHDEYNSRDRFKLLRTSAHRMLAASPDNRKDLWNKVPARDSQAVYGVAFTPDCQGMLTGDATGKVNYWDLGQLPALANRGAVLTSHPSGNKKHATNIHRMQLSKSGNLLLTAERDKVYLWRMAGNQANFVAQFPPEVKVEAPPPPTQPETPTPETPAEEKPKTPTITAMSFTPNEDAVIIAYTNQLPQIYTVPQEGPALRGEPPPPTTAPENNFVGIDPRYESKIFDNPMLPTRITAIAPFPGKDSDFVQAILAEYPNNKDAINVTESAAFVTDRGALFTSNIKDGSRFKRENPANSSAYTNLTITERGQWLFAARSDGIMERFFNQAIDYESVGVTDDRCLGSDEVKRRYAQELREKSGLTAKISLPFIGHVGPVYEMVPIVFRHTANADLEEIDGIVTIGLDGALITWQMLENCSEADRPRKTEVEVKVPFPDEGQTVSESVIHKWHVPSGTKVNVGQLIAEITNAEKNVTHLVAELSGYLRYEKPEGAKAKMGEVIGTITTTYEGKLKNIAYSDHFLTSLAVSPDYQYAATGTLDGTILLWWLNEEMDVD